VRLATGTGSECFCECLFVCLVGCSLVVVPAAVQRILALIVVSLLGGPLLACRLETGDWLQQCAPKPPHALGSGPAARHSPSSGVQSAAKGRLFSGPILRSHKWKWPALLVHVAGGPHLSAGRQDRRRFRWGLGEAAPLSVVVVVAAAIVAVAGGQDLPPLKWAAQRQGPAN